MINGHGDDISKHQHTISSNFSSNIYMEREMSELHTFLCSKLKQIHSYPEADAGSLAKLIAEQYGTTAANILVTNGATEAIYLLAQAYREKRSAILIPTFSEYEDACTIHQHQLTYYNDIEEIDKNNHLVWICNPNNPDGRIYRKDYLKSLVSQHPDTLFIMDQSYAYFNANATWTAEDLAEHPHVIVLHSMTKQFAVPGLRLGYMVADQTIIERVSKYCMPWSVNTLALEAGRYLIQHKVETMDLSAHFAESIRVQQRLREIEGVTVIPSQMHYFLCRLTNKKAADLKQWLIEQQGILIRDASNFRGLDEHYFRIAVQSPAENDQLVEAVSRWVVL